MSLAVTFDRMTKIFLQDCIKVTAWGQLLTVKVTSVSSVADIAQLLAVIAVRFCNLLSYCHAYFINRGTG